MALRHAVHSADILSVRLNFMFLNKIMPLYSTFQYKTDFTRIPNDTAL